MKSKIFKYLYGLLVLVPALAVFSTCAYVALNKNAKDSYSGNNVIQNETSVINSSLLQDNMYYSANLKTFISETNSTGSGQSPKFYPLEQLDFTGLGISQEISQQAKSFYFLRANDTYANVFLFDNEGTQLINYAKSLTYWASVPTDDMIFYFTLVDSYIPSSVKYGNYLLQYNFVPSGLDNAFYRSMEIVENHQLFSWVKGNFLYDGMNNFADIFNAKDTFLSFYFAYVLTMSLIYLAFEVLMLFINMARNLINAIQRKEW